MGGQRPVSGALAPTSGLGTSMKMVAKMYAEKRLVIVLFSSRQHVVCMEEANVFPKFTHQQASGSKLETKNVDLESAIFT